MENAESTAIGINAKSVFIFNPYVPEYRVPFFAGLEKSLRSQGINLIVLTGRANQKFRMREDFSSLPFHIEKKNLSIKIFGAEFRYIFGRRDVKSADAVVYEFSITNLNTWAAILLPRRHKVIIWGHGPGYLSRETRLRLFLQKAMARRVDHILTYTSEGRERLIDLGIADVKVTAVMNTVDTHLIQSAIDSLQESEITEFLLQHNLDREVTFFSFIGALDKTKRIRFVAEVLDVLWKLNPKIKLLVGGSGPDKHLLNESVARGQTVCLGRVGPHEKAIISKLANCIVNPGNTGLLAVDALAMGLPIVGTSARSSPEKGYLTEGESFHTLPDNPKDFAQELNRLIIERRLPRLTSAPPSLITFVNNFSAAIEVQLGSEIQNKLLLVTNLPAPYRLSLFEALAVHFDLTVAYTGWTEEGRMWSDAISPSAYRSVSVGKLVGVGKFKTPFPKPGIIKRLVKESNFVLTGGWHSPAFLYSMKLARSNGVPSLLWFESTLDSARYKSGPIARLRSWVFAKADAILVPGITAARAAESYAQGQTPVIVFSNPVNKIYLDAVALGLPKSRSKGTRFLFLGRLLQLKRVDLLISAFEMAASEGDSLTIVGDGPMLEELVAQAKHSELRDRIYFQSAVKDSEAIAVYALHDVLVLPSNKEVWGMVIAEALVLGLKVIGSSAAGASATFSKFSTFQSFQSESVDSLSEALVRARAQATLSMSEKQEILRLNSPEVFASRLSEATRDISKHGSLRGDLG